jgi:hypothetical protein
MPVWKPVKGHASRNVKYSQLISERVDHMLIRVFEAIDVESMEKFRQHLDVLHWNSNVLP